MTIRNDFSNKTWLICSAFCLAHYVYMTEFKKIALINQIFYPVTFLSTIALEKMLSFGERNIHEIQQAQVVDFISPETALKTIMIVRNIFEFLFFLTPVLSCFDSCYTLSRIPTKIDSGLSILTSAGMLMAHSYCDYEPA